jgi:hypothetical protein
MSQTIVEPTTAEAARHAQPERPPTFRIDIDRDGGRLVISCGDVWPLVRKMRADRAADRAEYRRQAEEFLAGVRGGPEHTRRDRRRQQLADMEAQAAKAKLDAEEARRAALQAVVDLQDDGLFNAAERAALAAMEAAERRIPDIKALLHTEEFAAAGVEMKATEQFRARRQAEDDAGRADLYDRLRLALAAWLEEAVALAQGDTR